jgi:enamine deaminase RidA (YjgF/YER057c/UK114 family)
MGDDIVRRNPAGLHLPPGYHHVTVVEAGRTAYLAGQCPLDADGKLVGPDNFAAQADQVALNAMIALDAIGTAPGRVVRAVIYVVSDVREDLSLVWEVFTGSTIGPAFTSASTLLGVSRLGFAGQLVELDLTVALSR